MKNYASFCLVVAILFGFSGEARATQSVSSPQVNAGSWDIELRNGLEFDERQSRDERITQMGYVDYAVYDWYAIRPIARWTKPRGAEHTLTALEFEQRFELLEMREYGYSVGSKLIYSHQKAHSSANNLQFIMLAEKEFSGVRARVNARALREIGSGAERSVALQASAQAVTNIGSQMKAGFEWFGNFGNLAQQQGYSTQQHQFGPVTQWKLNDTSSLEIGYLRGISQSATDDMVKFFIDVSF